VLFLRHEIREVNISGFDVGVFRQIVRYGLPLSIGFVLFAVAVNSDRQILASLADVYAVGLYTAAFDVADRIVHVPMVSVGSAAFAQAVRQLERHGPETTRPQLAENFTLLVAIGLPTAVGLAAVAGEFSGLALGADYRDAASTIIPVAALASFLSNLRSHYFDHAFQLGRRPERLLVVMGLLSIAAVGFNLLWIPSFGGVGAACAMLAAHAISLPICALLGRRAFRMPFPARETFLVVVAAAAMGIFVYSIPGGGSSLSLVSKVAAGIVTYLGIGALVLPDVFRKLLIWRRWASRLK
jgi:O-antigen/teichoic acid export membrane protein